MNRYRAGIDIGSTTVKLVVLDEQNNVLFGDYRRHHAHTQATLKELLQDAESRIGEAMLDIRITGSGSISLAKAMDIPFVQEVVAVATALQTLYPQTDVAIELGGEDAKIIYFDGGLEERMNGVCAGGTGSFIDQMAALIQTDASGLNEAAKDYKEIYSIAARCGVFAKSDIQPLINEGATTPDLAASIFQAVVNQTISGLACGKPIRGCVAFLGGPLHFLTELKKAFIRTLKLTPENIVDPEDSHLFAAIGAALESLETRAIKSPAPAAVGDSGSDGADEGRNGAAADLDNTDTDMPGHMHTFSELIGKLDSGVEVDFEIKRLEPLFADQEDYRAFEERHAGAVVEKADIASYAGPCYLGIDAGSTTTKIALIGDKGQLLYSFYSNNQGNPIKTSMQAMSELSKKLPEGAWIAGSCSTGYGEALLKAAFRLDTGEVETVAHTTAAEFFNPDVDCVLDIGGQDMKCITLKDHCVSNVMLNEACSSGCGSFIENFASSLGYTAQDFAQEALFAKAPVDLGTRCTVFMNSNVKQAQKEGAPVSDISAGLAYSVIKNALFKVIKLADVSQLGRNIVVQGGTFYNKAVLRAFEKISGVEVICPDISGIMGAFGAALIARDRASGKSSMLSFDEIAAFEYTTSTSHCHGCENRCMLTINTFPDASRYITGNRCEKVIKSKDSAEPGVNLVEYKKHRMFDYEPLTPQEAPRGVIGIPRVLNMYENYPYWAVFFRELGFSVKLSPFSKRNIYELGMESIPSESECYPAKLSHGHVQWLIDQGVKTIFHPCVFYEYQETKESQNHYNCPMVISYPENLKNNVEAITEGRVRYIRPFIAFTNEKTAADRLVELCRKEWGIGAGEVRRAAKLAWQEQRRAKEDIRRKGQETLKEMEERGKRGIVLIGRPYHIDPEINHGIPELVASYGFYVYTEDSIPMDEVERPIRVLDQWVFHARLYNAAEFVTKRDDMDVIQLFSFGCGLDAVTTDQVSEIMENSGKLYTVLKIDEVNNLGAARIRVRSLIAAINMRASHNIKAKPQSMDYTHATFTKQMYDEGYTLLCPDMSPIHFDLLEPIFRKYGYNVKVLKNASRKAIDVGLKYVNNDACYPSILSVGQLMEGVLSGEYDVNKVALLMSQTGGCCRASNYVSFIRRALDKAGLQQIPVISLNLSKLEENEGFKLYPKMLYDALRAIVCGDLMMKCLYRTRPYEKVKGSADALHEKWEKIVIDTFTGNRTGYGYGHICRSIVEDFDSLELDETLKKPRVGITGEILVKYMPLANNNLVELLEAEGAEAVVPDLLDFITMCFYELSYQHRHLGKSWKVDLVAKAGTDMMQTIRRPAVNALRRSKRFDAPIPMKEIAEYAKPFLSIGNQYGEGWFLCGEMVEMIHEGVPNIICVQPFACLPNHVVGKGVIKALKKAYPQANIAAIDYDPGASEVNQLNRIKLMLSSARKAMNAEE